MKNLFLVLLWACLVSLTVFETSEGTENRITISVDNSEVGAPVKFGIPFPAGELYSPDHVRVLNQKGEEILSQTTKVTSWEPADDSIKWLWVFLFADDSDEYIIEYGQDVRKTVFPEFPIEYKNNQRVNGFVEINTGPLHLRIDKGGSGFIDRVQYNAGQNGFDEEHIIASGLPERGSFLDLLDDAGLDTSRAVIHQHFIERGSGPLHAIVRIEGEYEYEQEDHENSPFVTYIHAYAGKPFVRVLHTFTYTGIPDKSEPLDGYQHPDIATQPDRILSEEERSQDEGLMEPKDRIANAGFGLKYHMDGNITYKTSLHDGKWWEDLNPKIVTNELTENESISLLQTGPDPTGIPPVDFSDKDQHMSGFSALLEGVGYSDEAEKAEGWFTITNGELGVSVGLKNMLEEYPNEIAVNSEKGWIHAHTWSPNEVPMSFERATTEPDAGMVGNFAQGITKTTEMILSFHDGDKQAEDIRKTMNYILDPPVAHAGAEWYSNSGVYGTFAGADNSIQELERSMKYKFQWMLFNQNWEPWYGMFDYGDIKNYFFNYTWFQWANNEPAQDFQWWVNFMRTGDSEIYNMARASSRHTMDVDNTHWPRPRKYRGDTNRSLDWFESEQQPEASPYVGIGRRHAAQQWTSKLSAHVWIQGWLASYYLDGYHRGLDVARLTGDYYLGRIFGEHGLTGRRLYLSVWNLAELYDATKEKQYLEELDDRVDRLLKMQRQQGGRAVIDRYGYSQNYVSHGLLKYLQMFDRPDIERALVQNGRSLFQTPPIDHDFESYLSSIHPLIVAYDITGKDQYFEEACSRARHLIVDEMEYPFDSYTTQRELADEMERVSHLPADGEGPSFRGGLPIWSFSGGMRIFGWTHAFSLPYLIERLENRPDHTGLKCVD